MLTSVKCGVICSFAGRMQAVVFAVIAAVILPQAFHVAGSALGVGSAFGESLLPMQLPILLVGFLGGMRVGLAAGVLAPLVSFLLTGMPSAEILPWMMAELSLYGALAGLVSDKKMSAVAKVLLVQFVGRAVYIVVFLGAVFAVGNFGIGVAAVYAKMTASVPGLLLQCLLLPCIMRKFETGSDEC